MKLFKKHFYILGEKPQTDWRRVFIAAAILALVVALYGVVFYHRTSLNDNNLELPVVETATSTVQAEENGGKLELSQTIELYLQKKARFEKMISELKKS